MKISEEKKYAKYLAKFSYYFSTAKWLNKSEIDQVNFIEEMLTLIDNYPSNDYQRIYDLDECINNLWDNF